MKYITLISAVALMVACGTTQQKSEEDSAYKGELRETISGDFNGDGKMERAELYCLLNGDAVGYNLHFSDETVKPLDSSVIEYSAMYMTNEGDLNGDGADDIGLFLHSGESYWGMYAVYTYSDGEWRELLSYGHNPGWNDVPMQELVRKHPTMPHCVIIRELSLDHPDMQERVVDLRTMEM
jgi:hypothetical protein